MVLRTTWGGEGEGFAFSGDGGTRKGGGTAEVVSEVAVLGV